VLRYVPFVRGWIGIAIAIGREIWPRPRAHGNDSLIPDVYIHGVFGIGVWCSHILRR
jgi:hypothetical protein